VVGEYRIERKLGQGGMGTVYAAIHPVIDKRVAIKVLHHELCANADAVTRFIQEARAVNRIGHPNIVDVFGFGTTEDGRAFLAMELLTGESLAVRIGRGVPPIDEACDILVEVTYALEAAHDAGIIHRDLKPDNVFLTSSRNRRPSVKLLDFGIAKLSVDQGMTAPVDCTQPGQMVGTPQYIAPEQARGKALDGSADVYALGVMAFELLAGRPPFLSDDPVELIAKHITLRPPSPSDFNADVPELADQLVDGMLEKDPTRRPSVAQVREQLERIRIEPPSTDARHRAAKRLRATEMTQAIVDDPVAARRRWSRWWFALAALVVAAIGVKIAMFAADGSDDDMTRPPTVESITARPLDHTPTPIPAQPIEQAPQPVATPPTQRIDEPNRAVEQPTLVPPKRPVPAHVKSPHKIHVTPHAKPETKAVETKPAEARQVETKSVEIKPAETKPVEIKATKPTPPPDDDDALRSPFQKTP
jgi:tRNA A-37 threonylcarbamoyl transferase component Bud32